MDKFRSLVTNVINKSNTRNMKVVIKILYNKVCSNYVKHNFKCIALDIWWEICQTSYRSQTNTQSTLVNSTHHNNIYLFLKIARTHMHIHTWTQTHIYFNNCIEKVAIGHTLMDRPHGHHFLYFLLLLLLFKLHQHDTRKDVYS